MTQQQLIGQDRYFHAAVGCGVYYSAPASIKIKMLVLGRLIPYYFFIVLHLFLNVLCLMYYPGLKCRNVILNPTFIKENCTL